MMRRPFSMPLPGAAVLTAALAVAGSLAACVHVEAPPEQRIVLSAAPPETMTLPENAPTVALGRVEVPEYLDSYDIISRSSAHTLKAAEGARWAERLPLAITRTLGNDLAADGIRTADDADWRLQVQIAQFEPTAGVVTLAAAWQVKGRSPEVDIARRSTIREDFKGGPAAQAAAMDRSLKQLAAKIADAIKTHWKPTSAQ